VKSCMKRLGRSPEHLKVLPGALAVVGDTLDEGRKKKALLDSLVHPDSGLASLSIALGCDATNFDLDGPLPEIPESNACKSGRERFVSLAKRDNLTVRQLAQIAGSFSGLTFVGTPATIADEMEQRLFDEGCDGFNIMFPYVPEGLEDFVDKVVPELQRRGLFRREYEGKTLRDNLGLPRPENHFFKSPKDLSGGRNAPKSRLRFDLLRTTDAARFARRLDIPHPVSPLKTSELGPLRARIGRAGRTDLRRHNAPMTRTLMLDVVYKYLTSRLRAADDDAR
jgi:hypothetical protein